MNLFDNLYHMNALKKLILSSVLVFVFLPLQTMSGNELTSDYAPLNYIYFLSMCAISLVTGALSFGALYKKENAEEKFWIQFYGKLFSFSFAIFITFLIATLMMYLI